MKKTIATIAAVTLIAMTGLFAQPKSAPEFKAPPKIELPAEADVKAYHESQAQALKILLDAQVKAKITTQEWADARLAALKALQADCKGFCFFVKGSHIFMADQIGRPFFGFHDNKPRHNDRPDCRPRDFGGKSGFDGKPGFDPKKGRPNSDQALPPAPQDESAYEPPVTRAEER